MKKIVLTIIFILAIFFVYSQNISVKSLASGQDDLLARVNPVKDGVHKEELITVSENGQACLEQNEAKDWKSCGTVKDYEGNTYATVQIGTQCWMKENIRTMHTASGASISHGTSDSYDIPYWYYPSDNSFLKDTYGLLYNWEAAKKVCPAGWHLPTEQEFEILMDYCSNHFAIDGNNAKALASNIGWIGGYEDNDIGRNPWNNDKSGFSAVPAGYGSGHTGESANLWSATPGAHYEGDYLDYNVAYILVLTYCCEHNATLEFGSNLYGCSVRCIRD